MAVKKVHLSNIILIGRSQVPDGTAYISAKSRQSLGKKLYPNDVLEIINTVTNKHIELIVNKMPLEVLKEFNGTGEYDKPVVIVNSTTYTNIITIPTPYNWISKLFSEELNLPVGCDPECAIVDDGTKQLYSASRLDGRVYTPSAAIGADGPSLEFRPPAAVSVYKLLENLKSLIKKADDRFTSTNMSLYCGATYPALGDHSNRPYCLGGHVHVGLPPAIRNNNKCSEIVLSLVMLLDDYVGTPLLRIDRPDPTGRRGSPWHYGEAGDFRIQPHGFEYRVPSAFWLAHPPLAAAVIGTVKAVSIKMLTTLAEYNGNAPDLVKDMAIIKNSIHRRTVINKNDLSIFKATETKPGKFAKALEHVVEGADTELIKCVSAFINFTLVKPSQLKDVSLKFAQAWA